MPSQSLRTSPAAERNKAPILEALRPRLPPPPRGGVVLEVASGTGQHVAFFAQHLPHLTFQPTEADAVWLPQLAALAEAAPNIRPPLRLDAAAQPWPVAITAEAAAAEVVAVFCANMIHISPWASAEGLLLGAGRLRAPLYMYGPFRFHGAFTAPSNAAFDQDLRDRDPAWGVRDLDDLTAAAAAASLRLHEAVALPSNNHLLVWLPS